MLKAGESHLCHRILLMGSFFSGQERSICSKGEMDTGEAGTQNNSQAAENMTREGSGSRHQICLELIQIDVERTIKSKRRSDRRDDLSNQPIQVRETGGSDAKILLANVINGLVVNLYRCMSATKQITRFDRCTP